MGAELDPKEEGLDVVEIVIVLSWIRASFSQPALVYVWSRLKPGLISGHVFFVFFSFFFFHLIIDSHTIPNSAGREFSHSYISLFCMRSWKRDYNATYEVVFLIKSLQGLWVWDG